MNNKQRSATMADAYQSMYLEEGLFGGKKKTPAKPEDLPAYKKLQTAINDRKNLGDFLNANPWQADPKDRKHISREDVDYGELVDFLLDEGLTDDESSAIVMIEHMSDEWFDQLVEKMSDSEARQKAFDSVKADVIKKHGKDSLSPGKGMSKSDTKTKKGSGSDYAAGTEKGWKQTYGKNKSFWD